MSRSSRLLLPAITSSLVSLTACHARAETPKTVTPSMEIEIDDRGPDKAEHVAKLVVGFVNGQAKVSSADGDARYDLEATTVRDPSPYVQLALHRGHGERALELEVRASIPTTTAGRIVIARIERADGRSTTVSARML